MYIVRQNDVIVGITDKVLRCKRQSNGVVIVSRDGEGIIWNGCIHNLPGYNYDMTIDEVADLQKVIEYKVESAVNPVEAQATYTAMMTDTLMTEE